MSSRFSVMPIEPTIRSAMPPAPHTIGSTRKSNDKGNLSMSLEMTQTLKADFFGSLPSVDEREARELSQRTQSVGDEMPKLREPGCGPRTGRRRRVLQDAGPTSDAGRQSDPGVSEVRRGDGANAGWPAGPISFDDFAKAYPKAARFLMRRNGGRVLRVPTPKRSDRGRRELRRRVVEALSCKCPDPHHHTYAAVARRFRRSLNTIKNLAN